MWCQFFLSCASIFMGIGIRLTNLFNKRLIDHFIRRGRQIYLSLFVRKIDQSWCINLLIQYNQLVWILGRHWIFRIMRITWVKLFHYSTRIILITLCHFLILFAHLIYRFVATLGHWYMFLVIKMTTGSAALSNERIPTITQMRLICSWYRSSETCSATLML